LTGLVKKIEQRLNAVAGKTARAPGVFVLLVNNADGLDQRLRAMAEREKLQRVNLCIAAPPKNYEIAQEAEVTVVIYTHARRPAQRVTANFALRKGELDAAKTEAIVKALSAVLPPLVHPVVAASRETGQVWNFTIDRPADGWFKPAFADRSWKTAPGGFGTNGTPGAVVRTEWKTGDIWLRRTIILPDGPLTSLHLQVHHDDEAEVYLNGVLATRLTGYTTGYKEVPIAEDARKTLRPGANVLAVHCKQIGGGQYIDVGLVELKR
jgi:hypothetical protein